MDNRDSSDDNRPSYPVYTLDALHKREPFLARLFRKKKRPNGNDTHPKQPSKFGLWLLEKKQEIKDLFTNNHLNLSQEEIIQCTGPDGKPMPKSVRRFGFTLVRDKPVSQMRPHAFDEVVVEEFAGDDDPPRSSSEVVMSMQPPMQQSPYVPSMSDQ